MNKINEQSASQFLANHYDEIKEEINDLSTRRNMAGIFQAIVNHINYLLANGQIEKIGIRLKYIGWLYKRGNEQICNLIENLFVRSFRGMKRRCTTEQWIYMYQHVPRNLKQIYLLQDKNCNLITQKSFI